MRTGDALILTREETPGRPALYDKNGTLLSPARIPCVPAEIFASVRKGERMRMQAHQSKKRSLLRKLRSWKVASLIDLAANEKR